MILSGIYNNSFGKTKVARDKSVTDKKTETVLHSSEAFSSGIKEDQLSKNLNDQMKTLQELQARRQWSSSLQKPVFTSDNTTGYEYPFKGMEPSFNSPSLIDEKTEKESMKNKLFDKLLDQNINPSDRQKIIEAFKYADKEKLQKVVDSGTKIFIDPSCEQDKGCYIPGKNQVVISPQYIDDPKTLGLVVNHEVLGHAYLDSKAYDSKFETIEKAKRGLGHFKENFFNSTSKKDVKNVGKLYKDYQERVMVDNAVAVRDLFKALEKYPGDKIPAKDVPSLYRKAFRDDTMPVTIPEGMQEAYKNDIISSACPLMSAKDLKINRKDDGSTEVSFEDIPVTKDELKVMRPIFFSTGMTGVALIAASISLTCTSIIGAATGLYIMKKALKKVYEGEYLRGEREVTTSSGSVARMNRRGNKYSITIPDDAKRINDEWSSYAFRNIRHPEEYLAEGLSRMNTSPETQKELKEKDNNLYNYILTI